MGSRTVVFGVGGLALGLLVVVLLKLAAIATLSVQFAHTEVPNEAPSRYLSPEKGSVQAVLPSLGSALAVIVLALAISFLVTKVLLWRIVRV